MEIQYKGLLGARIARCYWEVTRGPGIGAEIKAISPGLIKAGSSPGMSRS